MENKSMNNENVKSAYDEIGEDATEYGEFISSYFAWVGLSKQKEKVEELQNMTKPQ